MFKAYKTEKSRGRFKLVYFNGRGRAETIRLLFAASELPFEDERVPRDQWAELKPKTPTGALPILEVDGETLVQSGAIARFISKEAGMEGLTSLEQAKVDMICESITEIRENAAKAMFIGDDEQKAKALDEFLESCPTIFGNLQDRLQESGNNKGFFVGDKMTRADVHFYATVELLQSKLPNVLKGCDLLSELYDRVASDPNIARYLKTRPVTEF